MSIDTIQAFLFRWAKDESGATAVEYGLIATFIALAVIAGATAIGSKLNDIFQTVADTLGP